MQKKMMHSEIPTFLLVLGIKKANQIGLQLGQKNNVKSCFSLACGSKHYKTKYLLYQIHFLFTHTSGCLETAHCFMKKQNRVRIRLRLRYLKLEWNQSWIWGLHCSNKKQSEYLHFSLCDTVHEILKPVCLFVLLIRKVIGKTV